MKIAIVGGTWDDEGGKASSIVNHIINRMLGEPDPAKYNIVSTHNGGLHEALPVCMNQIKMQDPDIIFWLANVPNTLAKYNGVKTAFPKAIVITSKNNYDKQYTFQEMVAHALALKSNLFIGVTKKDHRYYGQVFDPLGNAWTTETSDFPALAMQALDRAIYLKGITRKPTIWSPEVPYYIPVTITNVKFLEVIGRSADKFHELIHPAEGVKRFLGNASFRCMNGFPSLRSANGDIYVSRRNVDKRGIGFGKFVQVGYNRSKDITWYRGEHKPSVDTVVQVQLYQRLRKIKFMIHSHVYVEGAPFTKNMVPCGGLEEVGEIERAIYGNGIDQNIRFAINLRGHGSLICAPNPTGFHSFRYIERTMPEPLFCREN